MERVRIYTHNEVVEFFAAHPNPKRYDGWRMRNDMILRVHPYYDGRCGKFIQIGFNFATDSQGSFVGVNMNHAIWRVLFELTDLLVPERKREDADVFKLLTDAPLRVAAANIRCGQLIDGDGSLTFFGHFMQNRFIRLRDLIDIDIKRGDV